MKITNEIYWYLHTLVQNDIDSMKSNIEFTNEQIEYYQIKNDNEMINKYKEYIVNYQNMLNIKESALNYIKQNYKNEL